MKLGISGAQITKLNIDGKNLGYEVESILNEAPKYFDETILIDPACVIHLFDPADNKPVIQYESENINNLNCCIFRGITGVEEAISLLARNLNHCGCDILDPPERFSGAPSGKMFDSLKGFNRKILPSTIFAFNAESASEALEIVRDRAFFPVIIKPGKGTRGEHVYLANKKGLVGVDAARDIYGKLHYIESNRSPQWKNFEAATGVNVAKKLLEYAAQNIKNTSALF